MTAALLRCMSARTIAGHLSGVALFRSPLRRKALFPDDMPVFAPGLILRAHHFLSPFYPRPYLARSGIHSSCSASECPKNPNVSSIFRETEKNIPRKCRLQNRPSVYLPKEKFSRAQSNLTRVRTFTKPALPRIATRSTFLGPHTGGGLGKPIAIDLHLSIFEIKLPAPCTLPGSFVSLLPFCGNPRSLLFQSKRPAIPLIPLNSTSQ